MASTQERSKLLTIRALIICKSGFDNEDTVVSWIEKYKGKFDQGWDKVREETLARQKELGIVPAHSEITEARKASIGSTIL